MPAAELQQLVDTFQRVRERFFHKKVNSLTGQRQACLYVKRCGGGNQGRVRFFAERILQSVHNAINREGLGALLGLQPLMPDSNVSRGIEAPEVCQMPPADAAQAYDEYTHSVRSAIKTLSFAASIASKRSTLERSGYAHFFPTPT